MDIPIREKNKKGVSKWPYFFQLIEIGIFLNMKDSHSFIAWDKATNVKTGKDETSHSTLKIISSKRMESPCRKSIQGEMTGSLTLSMCAVIHTPCQSVIEEKN